MTTSASKDLGTAPTYVNHADRPGATGRQRWQQRYNAALAAGAVRDADFTTLSGEEVDACYGPSEEQAAADPHIDHRSDIYAIGVMAYEMLSGRPPFTGTTPQQILAAHVTEAPDPVSKRRTAIPPALEQIQRSLYSVGVVAVDSCSFGANGGVSVEFACAIRQPELSQHDLVRAE